MRIFASVFVSFSVDLVLTDWNQIVQEIKEFAEITETYLDIVTFEIAEKPSFLRKNSI